MFRNRLSMHVMPVLLAVAFIVITERKLSATNETADVVVTSQPATLSGTYLNSFSLLNAGNIQHVATVCQVTRLVVNFIR